MLRLLSLSLVLVTGKAEESWSFKEFLSGDWELERHVPGQKPDFARYSLKIVGANLEGSYYEDSDEGRSNEMVVRVVFDDARSGQFQLAKLRTLAAPEPVADDEPPAPQPVEPQAEPKTAFEFDFRPQNGGRFHLSESRWLGKAGGTVQFLASDEDTFVFSKVSAACSGEGAASAQLTSWTALRQGGSRRKEPASKPRSMLQRYGWYVFLALLYFGFQAAKEKAAGLAGAAMKKGK